MAKLPGKSELDHSVSFCDFLFSWIRLRDDAGNGPTCSHPQKSCSFLVSNCWTWYYLQGYRWDSTTYEREGTPLFKTCAHAWWVCCYPKASHQQVSFTRWWICEHKGWKDLVGTSVGTQGFKDCINGCRDLCCKIDGATKPGSSTTCEKLPGTCCQFYLWCCSSLQVAGRGFDDVLASSVYRTYMCFIGDEW